MYRKGSLVCTTSDRRSRDYRDLASLSAVGQDLEKEIRDVPVLGASLGAGPGCDACQPITKTDSGGGNEWGSGDQADAQKMTG